MAMPPEEREKFNARRREKFKEWKRDDIVAEFQEHNHAIEAIISADDQFAHPQLIANDMVETVVDPDVGETTQIGTPLHMFGTPAAIQGPQPTRRRAQRRDPEGARPVNALEGVRLIDFGQYLAGPFGPMVIGDLGADVIKVEPVTGDGMRMAGKPFFGCQRGKRDIALNIKDPRGRALALELVATADIVHHNMTAGVATKLGIDYAACKAVKPDIVYCNTWAYGLEGPLARFGGLDPLYQASSGLEYESAAVREGNTPLYYRFGMCDASNAMLSVVAVLGALYHRKRTGEGQELWTSLFDGGAIFTSDAHLVGGTPAPRPASRQGAHGHLRHVPALPHAGRRLDLHRRSEGRRLRRAVRGARRARDRDDARFATNAEPHRAPPSARIDHRAAASARRPRRFWTRTLDDAGVPNEVPVDTQGGEGPLFDADNVELGLVAHYEHPLLGDDAPVRRADQLLGDAGPHRRPAAARRCQDTRTILHELGHGDDEIDTLIADNVLLRARRPLRGTLRELKPEQLKLLPPGAYTGELLGELCVPDDLFWVAREPVALAGMSYPGRADWHALHEHGIGHVVCLTHDVAPYDPAPCTVTAFRLQDLVSGGPPRRARHRTRRSRCARPTTSARILNAASALPCTAWAAGAGPER